MPRLARTSLLALLLAAPAFAQDAAPRAVPSQAAAAMPGGTTEAVPYKTVAQLQSVLTEAGPVAVAEIASGLDHPWAMAFLPDGRLLVTERDTGKLRLLNEDGSLSSGIEGVPQVFAQGQGGLLDIALDPDFEENRLVYLTYAQPSKDGASTALGRGELVEVDGPTLSGESQTGADAGRALPPYAGAGNLDPVGPYRLDGFEVLFVQGPEIRGPNHFGSRIVFDEAGHVLLALGERFQFEPAQDAGNTLGTVVRLNRDGSVPEDSPFAGDALKDPAIFSYGHRNIQAAALHPDTGQLWVAEMGPLGGDELNAPKAGANFGWPLVSAGMNYDGSTIPDPATRPDLTGPAHVWTPTISPSGMAFYEGDVFPDWRGSALIGSLSDSSVMRIALDGEAVAHEERIPVGARVRDVAEGPDGLVYLLTDQDDGKIWRLVPLPEGNSAQGR